MSLLKNSFIGISLLLCVIYISFTKEYYNYCNYVKQIVDDDIELDKKEIFLTICNDVFKDYSKHSILKFSFGLFYPDQGRKTKIEEKEYNNLKRFLNEVNIYGVKMELKILQIVHFVYYVLVLYVVIVSLTRFLISILYYFVEKLLVIIFLVMIVEGVIIMFLGLDLDLVKLLKLAINYVPLNLFGGLIYSVFEYFGKIFMNKEELGLTK